jgi:hypothetical protein
MVESLAWSARRQRRSIDNRRHGRRGGANMAYKWGLFGRVFVVRWTELNPSEFPTIVRDIGNARRAANEPIIYVIGVPAEVGVPNSEQREALKELGEKLNEFCSEYYFVFEGDSIKLSIQRTVISGVMMVLQKNTFVMKSLEDAAKKIAARHPGIDATALVAQARTRGLTP